jgi:L-lactate dehydrogenase complex protein LldG
MIISKYEVLATASQNQLGYISLPKIPFWEDDKDNITESFINTLTNIGANVMVTKTMADIRFILLHDLKHYIRKVTTVPLLGDILELANKSLHDPHAMGNIDYAVIEADLAVAENGAVWIAEDKLYARVLPFVCQHLAVIVKASNIVPTRYKADQKIAGHKYGFGTLIAGPSKAADIKQSLVLGTHSAKSLTVFLLP